MTNTPNSEHQESRLARGIYLLPNLFTTAGLFSGFYAIIAAMKGLYGYAAVTIFIAMVADGLDGRVARLTNTTSAFGAEYDSLADIVAFGIAPAVTAYSWALHSFGKVGWLIAFFYVAAGALRLARFNVHVEDEIQDKRYFYGVPIPAAAGVVTSTMWFAHVNHINGLFGHLVLLIVTILAAGLMVSNVRYFSFKEFDFKGKVPFVAILIVVLIFVGIAIDPPSILFLGFLAYLISGPILMLLPFAQKKS